MTDREIAIEIGKRLIQARFRIEAMDSELNLHRKSHQREIPWGDHHEQLMERMLEPKFLERISELERALQACSPEELLRTLYDSMDRKIP